MFLLRMLYIARQGCIEKIAGTRRKVNILQSGLHCPILLLLSQAIEAMALRVGGLSDSIIPTLFEG